MVTFVTREIEVATMMQLYQARKPVAETLLSDLKIKNMLFDEELIPSFGGG